MFYRGKDRLKMLHNRSPFYTSSFWVVSRVCNPAAGNLK